MGEQQTPRARAVIETLARRPFRPANRTVTWTPPTTTVRDWPGAYQSVLLDAAG